VSGAGPARWANPVALLAGPGAADTVGRESAALGRRALVVCDRRLAARRHVRDVVERLTEAGLAVTMFGEVDANPTLADVRRAVAMAHDASAELVVGVGGGSTLDCAKTVAAAARVPALLDAVAWEAPGGLVEPAVAPATRGLALVQIPTTHATGSELNPIASLVDDRGDKRLLVSPHLYATLAIVDPQLHMTVPAAQTAEGSLETLCRVLVPYLTDATDRALPDVQAEATLRVVLERTPAALADGSDVATRLDLALATVSSVQGLGAFGRSRYGHVLWYLANALALQTGATKGQALAPLLRVALQAMADGSAPAALGHPRRLARFGSNVLGTGPSSAAAAAAALQEHMTRWGLPRGLDGVDVDALVAQTRRLWDGEPLAGLSDADLRSVYRAAADG
jgi:alcohol dehydrogenase class IV